MELKSLLGLVIVAGLALSASVSADSFIGKAISADWFFRDSNLPPKRETISPESSAGEGGNQKIFKFAAFDKKWRIEGVLNTALFSKEKTLFETRTEFGKTVSTTSWNRENCFYVGHVTTEGNLETGVAAFSTCHGLRALLVTNLNDYVIKPASEGLVKRKEEDALSEMHHISIEPRDAHAPKMPEPQPSPSKDGAAMKEKSPTYDSLVGPTIPNPKTKGFMSPSNRVFATNENRDRQLVVELGIIVDQEYLDKVKKEESSDDEWLMFHFLERINWVQLWYIHPTFGYVWWWYIHKVIINDKVIDYKKYDGEEWDTDIDKVCNWQNLNQPDSDSWDHTLIFSSKPHIWGTRPNGNEYIGRAIADGACDRRKHCVGVKDMTYQWGTWTRLAAHENAHDFGIPDDYPESGSPTSAECYAGLMRMGVYQDHEWGKCSVEWFEGWKAQHGSCLDVRTHAPEDLPLPELLVNVAYRAEAEQSSSFGSVEEFGAQKATDGPLLGVPSGLTPDLASCTQTKRQKDPWILVKLEKSFAQEEVERVVVFNRPDFGGDRLHDFEVRVGDVDDDLQQNALCGKFEGAAPGGDGGAVVVECAAPLKGGVVSVQIKGEAEILTVCEIQVFQSSANYAELSMPKEIIPKDVDHPECVDKDASCRMWANGGECWKNPTWMSENCPRSCNVCINETCHDFDGECAAMAAAGECESNGRWMSSNCPVSCKTCQEICVDFNDNCAAWTMMNECEKNPGWMHKNCMKSCGVCGDPDCVDEDKRCSSWKDANECMKQPDWMTKHCPRSCNGCTNKCVDTVTNCPVWASAKECLFNPEWMGMFCRKSCQTCLEGTNATCKDSREECEAWRKDGHCEGNPYFMLRKCEKTCGACGPLRPTLDPNGCYDRKPECTYWEALGECTGEHKDWMEEMCPNACLICTDQKPKCEDQKDSCPTWADGGQCITNAAWMWQNCRKSCGICGDNQDCVEADSRCKQWASEGECQKNPNYMLHSCQKSCGICDDNHVCKNEMGDKCYAWAHSGYCTIDPDYMNEFCRKACNLCGCIDKQTNCPSWAQGGECESNPSWMQVSCRKSCKTCDGGSGGGGGGGGAVTSKPVVTGKPVVTDKPVAAKTTAAPVVTVATVAPGSECFDKNQECRKFAGEGLCTSTDSWGQWMRDNCLRACGSCDPTTAPHSKDCVDADKRCENYAQIGRCEDWPEWVWQYCKKSCGFCN